MAFELRGEARRFTLRTAALLTLLSAVGSLALLGAGWLRFAVFSSVLLAVPIVALYSLLRRLDRFTLDDERRRISAPWRKAIDYDQVKSFRVHETAGLLGLSVWNASSWSTLLISADPERLSEIRLLLEARWPDAAWRESRGSALWSVTAAVLLPLVAHEAYVGYLAGRHPGVRSPCRTMAWSASDAPAGPGSALGGFLISPPDGFTPAEVGGGLRFHSAESPETEIEYTLEAFDAGWWASAVLRYGMGLEGSAAMVRWSVCAQNGVLPLTAKSLVTGEAAGQAGGEPRFWRFPGGTAVIRSVDAKTEALLYVAGAAADLRVRVTSDDDLAESFLQQVVAGIQPAAQ